MKMASNSCRSNYNNVEAMDNIQGGFEQIRNCFVWPTPKSTPSDISSTFGPRIKVSTNGYDFHRGIDIHGNIGDPILASYDGTVTAVGTWKGGGKYITIQHKFDTPVILLHNNGGKITKTSIWYSLYLHLNVQLVSKGDIVKTGDKIGEMGMTGSTSSPHLHHEVRIGTCLSLEYHINNNNNNKYNFDPHIHPLYLYPHVNTNAIPTLFISQKISCKQDGIITITTSTTDPNVNRYDIQIIDDDNNNTIIKEHTLDLNLRIGFTATSTLKLDTPDCNYPYLYPIPFGYTKSEWKMNLIIPTKWLTTSKKATGCIVITVTTIWGKKTKIEFMA